MEATQIEYVTAADLRSWNWASESSRLQKYTPRPKHVPDNPKPPRQRKERKPKEINLEAQAQATERRKRVKDAVQYRKTVEQRQAVVKALEVVTVKLGFNLSDSSTPEARKHRRKGWHTFCALIMVSCREYSARGIDAALSVPGKPCREVLSSMFLNARAECGYTEAELRRLIQ